MTRENPWTEERVALLKERYGQGYSAGQIANELACGITRNAVIGKALRLGLTRPIKKPRKDAPPPQPRIRVRQAKVIGKTTSANAFVPVVELPPEPIHQSDAEIPGAQRIKTVLGLNSTNCHWPVGEVGTEEFFFCGGNAVPDRPYCAYHCACAHETRSLAERLAERDGERVARVVARRKAA